jgi:hypothetical protein
MANFITASTDMIDNYIFGDKSYAVKNYVANQIEHFYNVGASHYQGFINKLEDVYNYVTSSFRSLMRHAADDREDIHTIGYINSWRGLHEASPIMQRYIMASPEVAQYHKENKIQGYAGFEPVYPKNLPTYDYDKVVDGIILDHHDYVTHTIRELVPGDKELDFYEQVQIIKTWDVAKWLLKECKFDFTASSDDQRIG